MSVVGESQHVTTITIPGGSQGDIDIQDEVLFRIRRWLHIQITAVLPVGADQSNDIGMVGK